jgi:hypothetical protein
MPVFDVYKNESLASQNNSKFAVLALPQHSIASSKIGVNGIFKR